MSHAQTDNREIRLPALVNMSWAWLQVISAAAADSHADTVRSREENRIALGHQFFEALYEGQAEEAQLLARTPAFDPKGEFQAVCCPSWDWPQNRIEELRRGPAAVLTHSASASVPNAC